MRSEDEEDEDDFEEEVDEDEVRHFYPSCLSLSRRSTGSGNDD